MLEEFIKTLEHADAIKDIMHDIKPPQPFALFDSGGLGRCKHRRGRIVKGSPERLGNQLYRLRLGLVAELHGMLQVDLRHGPVHMEQCLCSIEKDHSNRPAHWRSLPGVVPERE